VCSVVITVNSQTKSYNFMENEFSFYFSKLSMSDEIKKKK
jgi:hypothetical protein